MSTNFQMKKLKHLTPLFFLLILGCSKHDATKVTIATASNMQFAMKEIANSFTQQTGIDCDIVFSSSGKLTAQIKEGAPYDIFVSADTKYPTVLYNKGFTTQVPEVYAHGQLVLWSLTRGMEPNLKTLTRSSVRHIAIANPKTAPYGEAAISVLKHFGIYETVKDKLVYGESISQTNQFIISGAAEIGFTAKSVVLSNQMKEKGSWMAIASESYTPIAQAAVIIKKDLVHENALKFYEFLFSSTSQEILENFGYLVSAK